jgi:hypothetical protein
MGVDIRERSISVRPDSNAIPLRNTAVVSSKYRLVKERITNNSVLLWYCSRGRSGVMLTQASTGNAWHFPRSWRGNVTFQPAIVGVWDLMDTSEYIASLCSSHSAPSGVWTKGPPSLCAGRIQNDKPPSKDERPCLGRLIEDGLSASNTTACLTSRRRLFPL